MIALRRLAVMLRLNREMEPWTTAQRNQVQILADAARPFEEALDTYLPDGPDKRAAQQNLRAALAWARLAIVHSKR